ncbi:hypothetical protein [Streptomyces luteogriseus]|uniref:hypothetical protein n=1 Tax=Streptomyces luteogriseus TaxID=68233 RepID=UPI003710615F
MPRPLPVSREEIATLLRRGDMTESAIARKLGVSRPTVGNVRKTIGLPTPRQGQPPTYPSIEDAYRAHAVPRKDGHVEWTGLRTGGHAPMVKHCRSMESAYRVAFRLHHGRDPEGLVYPACGTEGCVAGAHVEDTVMRRARKRSFPNRAPRSVGPSRADIIALLQEGHSDRYIARALSTATRRVSRIRSELGLPKSKRKPSLTLEQKWRTFTKPTTGGHLEWTGSLRDGTTPVFMYCGHNYMARRLAFRIAHQREPVGRVLPGCGYAGCVAPEHVEDQPMREALRTQYTAIFGAAA